MALNLVVITAICLDRIFGEPPFLHPLIGFGQLCRQVEKVVFCYTGQYPRKRILHNILGVFSVILVVAPCLLIGQILVRISHHNFFVSAAILYFSIGAKSLSMHATAVERELRRGDLARAREKVALIVSRDTENMEIVDVVRATIESVLENGNDAIFGAIFWFAVMGPIGAILFRLVNTLDAMWGYRNERYRDFGWAAARLDDILNLIPARLSAFSYAAVGHFFPSIQCWRNQSNSWYSPNAGPVMAAGAGALMVVLGGPATYHSKRKSRPKLGIGRKPVIDDIGRAVHLVHRAIIFWLVSQLLICAVLERASSGKEYLTLGSAVTNLEAGVLQRVLALQP